MAQPGAGQPGTGPIADALPGHPIPPETQPRLPPAEVGESPGQRWYRRSSAAVALVVISVGMAVGATAMLIDAASLEEDREAVAGERILIEQRVVALEREGAALQAELSQLSERSRSLSDETAAVVAAADAVLVSLGEANSDHDAAVDAMNDAIDLWNAGSIAGSREAMRTEVDQAIDAYRQSIRDCATSVERYRTAIASHREVLP